MLTSMAGLTEILTSILVLLGTASFMIVISLISSGFLKPSTPKKGWATKAAIGVIGGLLAVFGTVMGTKLADGTIINVRELAAMIAGAAGGPVGGVIAGLIGGLQRYTMGGATALPCTISTVAIGLITGLVSMRLTGKFYLVKGAVLGVVLESAAMGLILVLVPFNQALAIVQQIAVPMVAANTIGLVLWLYLADKWKKTQGYKTKNS
jgi:LytS/YehU family sensor histidine kinase